MPIRVVGLSGKYCAGKSTIGSWLKSSGAFDIEADYLGHQAIIDCQEQIVARFGTGILANGTIDRKALGRAVFNKPEALAVLEAIIHPVVIQVIKDLIAERRNRFESDQDGSTDPLKNSYAHIIVLNAALLFKSGLDKLCDLVLWVDAPWIVRFWRGLRRDKRGFKATYALMVSQKMLGPQHQGSNADIIKVYNLCRPFARARVCQILERFNG